MAADRRLAYVKPPSAVEELLAFFIRVGAVFGIVNELLDRISKIGSAQQSKPRPIEC